MVVRAYWPGATAQQMADQVTDKLEKTLQEVPYADKIRSYSKPGETLTSSRSRTRRRRRRCRRSGTGAQEDRRHARHAAGRRGRPVLQRRVRRCLRFDLRPVGRRLQQRAEGAGRPGAPAPAEGPDVSKVEMFGAQDEKIFIEISQQRLAQLGLDINQVLAQLASRTRSSRPARSPRRAKPAGARGRAVQLGRRAARSRSARTAPACKLGDIAEIRRGLRRSAAGQGAPPGSGSDRAGRVDGQGGDIVELGKALRPPMAIAPSCRSASRCSRSRTSRRSSRDSVGEFVSVLIEAVRHRAAGQLRQPRAALQARRWRIASTGGPAWWSASRSRWCWRSPSW